jgi:hypothetical protein
VAVGEFFQCGCDVESPASDSDFGACDRHGQATVTDAYCSDSARPLEVA